MTSSPTAPSVLILGGIAQGLAPALLCHLFPSAPGALPLVAHVRLCDKYLLVPSDDVWLRWVHPAARKILRDNVGKGVEYLQVNLANDQSREKAFTPPSDAARDAWDIVVDFLQEDSADIHGDQALYEKLARVAQLCGAEALKRSRVKAYMNFHNDAQEQGVDPIHSKLRKTLIWSITQCPLKESDGSWRPTHNLSKWWHEGIRALANYDELPLVVLRFANPWGPTVPIGFTRRMTVAAVYKYLGKSETMEFLWGKDLVLEHVHGDDIASATMALANWQINEATTRAAANSLAGSPLPPCRPAAVSSDEEAASKEWDSKEIPGLAKRTDIVTAPLFHVSDGSVQTQGELGKILEQVMEIKVDFHSAITNALARMHMSEVMEIAEEKHAEPWLEMLSASTPPINNTPLSAALPNLILRKNRCHMDISKIKATVGWTPKHPRITAVEVRRIRDGFLAEGIWPNAPPKK